MTSSETSDIAALLGDSDAALARSNAYGFLAELVAGPVSAELCEQVASVAELALTNLDPADSPNGARPSLDELAAAHYELFGLQVFAHAGVFLDADALAGGDRVANMIEGYRRFGFVSNASEGPDHFACQLAFLAHLTRLEVAFRADGDRDSAQRVIAEQRHFLDTHLLPWAVPLLAACRAVDAPLFTKVTDMAVRVAADHRCQLGGVPQMAGPAVGPDASEMLSHAKTSVRDIAEFLLSPSRSGFWMTRADIQDLGRGSDVPRGFGSRAQLLSNLLRNAAEYDLVDSLLGAMDTLLAEQAAAQTKIGTELSLDVFAKPWLERIAATKQMIDEMAEALSGLSSAQTR